MATNYDLSSASSFYDSSASSSDEDVGLAGSNRKIDLSFQDLDSDSLENSLVQLDDGELAPKVEKILLYNNRISHVPSVIAKFTRLTLLDLSNNLMQSLPHELGQVGGIVAKNSLAELHPMTRKKLQK
jgi:Leucine-rich repeat (LRR) protein